MKKEFLIAYFCISPIIWYLDCYFTDAAGGSLLLSLYVLQGATIIYVYLIQALKKGQLFAALFICILPFLASFLVGRV